MTLQNFIQPWTGEGFRHLPDGNYEVYDFSYAGLASDNRWNVRGEPTLYLASGLDVAAGEWSRHFQFDRPKQLAAKTKKRKVYCFEVRLTHTLDLCNLKVCQALSLVDAPNCFLDKNIARATAQFVRQTTSVQAIFVPSIAFLDRLDKWVLVLFLEKLVVLLAFRDAIAQTKITFPSKQQPLIALSLIRSEHSLHLLTGRISLLAEKLSCFLEIGNRFFCFS